MATDLEKENLINALTDQNVVRACVNCKHYTKQLWEDALCERELILDWHPVTGKKSWLGSNYACKYERIPDASSLRRSSDPCGLEGKHFEAKPDKPKVKWFSSWFPKTKD